MARTGDEAGKSGFRGKLIAFPRLPTPRCSANRIPTNRVRSSAVEHRLHTAGVTGSIPVAPTTINRSFLRVLRGFRLFPKNTLVRFGTEYWPLARVNPCQIRATFSDSDLMEQPPPLHQDYGGCSHPAPLLNAGESLLLFRVCGVGDDGGVLPVWCRDDLTIHHMQLAAAGLCRCFSIPRPTA